jgi:hypothetical protein
MGCVGLGPISTETRCAVKSRIVFRSIRAKGAILFACVALSACRAESLKRTGYETAQNIGEQQCREANAEPCNERVSYETYERERKAD